jgi:dephospho-CoA kinase
MLAYSRLKHMQIVGLTGGIASGKSSVARVIRNAGFPVIDADEVARSVVAPGQPALALLRDTFGNGIFHSDGSLNREALGQRVFQHPEDRKELEAITHPRIAEETAKQIQELAGQGHQLVFYEAALLVETGRTHTVHKLILVAASPEEQIARLLLRDGFSEQDARARLAAQMPLHEKRPFADFIIENRGGIEELTEKVETLLEALQPGDAS